MARYPLAVAILTLNEKSDLPPCIDSLADLKCPIFVVDSNSKDGTQEIAKKMGAKVITFNWNGKYPKKKQWTLENLSAEFEWVLLLDADERLSTELSNEIQALLSSRERVEGTTAFEAQLDYSFQGRILKHGLKATKQILFKTNHVRFPEIDDLAVSRMWEVEGHYQPTSEGKVQRFSNKLLHSDTGGLFDYISRHNRYSDWEAYVNSNYFVKQQVYGEKKYSARIFSALPFKGLAIFSYSYFFKLGFLDGRAGFDFAIHRMFYQWQIKAKSVQNDY